MIILVPVLDKKGMDSAVSPHFGHTPFFAVYDSEKDELKIEKNKLNHIDPVYSPVDQLMIHKPDIVYVLDIGQRAIDLFKEKGIILKTGNYKRLRDVVDNVDSLEEVKSSCGH